jgi:hypothetical protein
MRFICSRKPPFGIFASLLLASTILHAQNSPTSAGQGNLPQAPSTNTGVYSGREIYVPESQKDGTPEASATSFADGFLRDARKHVGFSVALSETYTPNAFQTLDGPEALTSTSVVPQLYLDVNTKHLGFRLNYSASYNRYSRDLGEPSILQNGSAGMSYSVSRRKLSFAFIDYLSSSYYDAGTALTGTFTNPYLVGTVSPQLFVDSTRTNRNSASATLNHQTTKKLSLSATLSDDYTQYGRSATDSMSQLSGSVSMGLRLKKWLKVNSRYTRFLNNVNSNYRGNNIQDVQIGEFVFEPIRNLSISFSGGIESADTPGQRSVSGSGRLSVVKRSGRTTIGLGYHHGLYTAFPSPELWHGDSANIYAVQKLTRRISIHANGALNRGTSGTGASIANSAYGGASVDVVLQRNLVLTGTYSFISQSFTNVLLPNATNHRTSTAVSLHYFLPSVRP